MKMRRWRANKNGLKIQKVNRECIEIAGAVETLKVLL